MIPGTSNDSGRGPSLDASAKLAVLSPGQERFLGSVEKGSQIREQG